MLTRALRPKMGQAQHRAPLLPVQGTQRSQLMKHTVSSRKASLPAGQKHQGTADKRTPITPKAVSAWAGYSRGGTWLGNGGQHSPWGIGIPKISVR